MEKYVFEAMFQMGYAKEALARHKKRFGSMVNNPNFTTLFEGWGIGKEGFGGGTVKPRLERRRLNYPVAISVWRSAVGTRV